MNDQPNPSPQASARRRLLRGAFSAPAVLTLYSGSAMATKSNERCLINQTTNTAVTPAPSENEDSWFRIQLGKEPGKDVYWVFSNDLPLNRSILVGANQAQQFGVDPKDKQTFNKLVGQGPTTSLPTVSLTETPKKYATLRVDNTGTVIGIGSSGSTAGSAIAQSCWNSFRLGA